MHEQEPGGVWRNHARDNPLHQQQRLPPDLDDISTVSYTLSINGIPFDDNHSLIRHNRNDQDLFLTWIDPPFANEADALPWSIPTCCSIWGKISLPFVTISIRSFVATSHFQGSIPVDWPFTIWFRGSLKTVSPAWRRANSLYSTYLPPTTAGRVIR